MSTKPNLEVGATDPSYTVQRIDGCTLVTGAMPMSHFIALAKSERGAVVSPHLSRLANVTFAWGRKSAVDTLIAVLTAKALSRPGMTDLERWLAVGERGSSSDAVVCKLAGVAVDTPKAHPHDPDDLSRIVMLLEDVPGLRADINRMAEVSVEWEALIASWSQLIETFMSEVPSNWRSEHVWSAPKTMHLMDEIMESVPNWKKK